MAESSTTKRGYRKRGPKAFHDEVRAFLGEEDPQLPEDIDEKMLAGVQQEALVQMRSAERLLKAKRARNSLINYTEFLMPDPKHPDDVNHSKYQAKYFHKAMAAALEGVENGSVKRLILTLPPRHGKSQLASRSLPAWYLGRNPDKSVMFATYNEPFAEDFGKDVRAMVQSQQHHLVFPKFRLRKGSASSGRLQTTDGGMAVFVGRGGSITGRGADLLVIDDIIKDQNEARSKTIRDECWDWFTKTAMTRLMSDEACVIIIMTRWHEDDLVGRITDPDNPYYNEQEAADWKIINIPAIAEHNDVLGRKVGQALWPGKFGIGYLRKSKLRDPVGFSALYQQRPTPEDGDLITKGMIRTYRPEDMPSRLRLYAASDHAIKTGQENDFTVMIIVGVDMADNIWVLDVWWDKKRTDVVVEKMIDLMDAHRPLIWWAAKDHITGSIGPFLYKRMRERRVFVTVRDSSEKGGDKVQKAQPLIGRMGSGKVRFPKDAPWFEKAKQEMLKFPGGKNDDFVDALAHIGRGLDKLIRPSAAKADDSQAAENRYGTMAWLKKQKRIQQREERIKMNLAGM